VIADPPSDAGSAHARATDCEAEVVVSDSGTEGTVAGAATKDAEYANLFGESTPALPTTFGEAASVIALVTAAGVADAYDSK
jgi:hypothetical protein